MDGPLRRLNSRRRAVSQKAIRMAPRIRTYLVAALVGLISAAAASCGGSDGPLELRLGHVGQPGSLYDVVATEYARLVNERLAGQAELIVFGSSQLGNDETMLQKLKLGTMDLSLPSTVMSSAVDAFGLFEMPYLVSDRAHMKRIEDAVVWPELVPQAEAKGYTVLAVWENGFRQITNSVRPIHTPTDLADIKLRTPRGIWRVKLFQAYGANPTPMPFTEVFVALQTGVVDGQENPLSQIYSAKIHEVQEYLTVSNHVYTPAFVTAGTNQWNSLPQPVRDVLAATAKEIQPFVYEQAERLDREFLEAIRESGTQVNEADRDAFVAASGAIYEEFGATVDGGASLIEAAMAAATEATDPSEGP
jgi:tripartite ATP-independent transporter DctP family solute receptor